MPRNWLSSVFLSSFAKATVACQDRTKILRPAPESPEGCIHLLHNTLLGVSTGLMGGPGSEHQGKTHRLVFDPDSLISDAPGCLVDKCEGETEHLSFNPKEKDP